MRQIVTEVSAEKKSLPSSCKGEDELNILFILVLNIAIKGTR